MNDSTLITAIITAVGGFISAYFILKNNDKSNQLKYITEERTKWRDKIRKLSVAFITSELYENGSELVYPNKQKLIKIREQVAVRLNPKDTEDDYILCLMDCYIENNCDFDKDEIRKRLSVAFASLLKHDWERVKNEAKMESNSSKLLMILVSALTVALLFNIFSCGRLNIYFEIVNTCCCDEYNNCNKIFLVLIYIISILTLYKLLKYWFWLYKYDIEKNQSICPEKPDLKDDCFRLHKYLGFNKRPVVTKFKDFGKKCCK